jgi:hypothetical protein
MCKRTKDHECVVTPDDTTYGYNVILESSNLGAW